MKKNRKLLSMMLAFALLLTTVVIANGSYVEAADAKLSKKAITLYVENTKLLTVSNTGSKKITWKNSNPKVADIFAIGSNATIIGKKAGTTTVKAIVGKKTLSCKVTIKNPTIKSGRTDDEIYSTRDTTTLKLSSPCKVKEWKSSDNSIARIYTKNGKVYLEGRKKGIVCVSATLGNGSVVFKRIKVLNPSFNNGPHYVSKGKKTLLYFCGIGKEKVKKVSYAKGYAKTVAVYEEMVDALSAINVKGLKKGTETITVTLTNGMKFSTKLHIK